MFNHFVAAYHQNDCVHDCVLSEITDYVMSEDRPTLYLL